MLSVVTITFRDPEGLAATIRSLRPLLGRVAWEHVVVDGSPDESSPVLAKLPAGWPLVHVVEKPAGIYAAMNSGIARSQGNFLWFLNGGDTLADVSVLERALDSFAADPTLDIRCHAVWPVEKGVRTAFARPPLADFSEAIRTVVGAPHQGMVYRSSVFARVGPYDTDFRIIGDYAHHWRCVRAGLRVSTSTDVLAEYDADGVSADAFTRWVLEMERLNARLRGELSEAEFAAYLRRYHSGVFLRFVRHVGRRFPGLRAVIAPMYRAVVPDPIPRSNVGA